MIKFIGIFFIYLLSLSVYADSFCGVVLAENGLNIRTQPSSLTGNILYKLNKGETFRFYSDGYTGVFQTIIDGNETVEGQWIKINLKTLNEKGNPEHAYLFLSPKYATEMYDCRAFKHPILEEELYNSGDTEYALKRKDTLKTLVELTYLTHTSEQNPLPKSTLITNEMHYDVKKDTLLLKLDNGNTKKIISYPFGKLESDESREEYTYVGYVEQLNSYLISGSYYESGDYFFVSKNNGIISNHFYGLPNMSPNAKLMLVIEEDMYEEGTNVSIYEIDKTDVKLKINYNFTDWYIDGKTFWISNQEALIPARSVKDHHNWTDPDYDNYAEAQNTWKEVGKHYVRMKIL